jgi:hypothetical protein
MTKQLRASLVSAAAIAVLVAGTLPLRATENIDYDGINKIKQNGLNAASSKVMEIMSYLTDVYGPRLTGSPNVKKAADWAVGQMKEWGLTNRGRRVPPKPPPRWRRASQLVVGGAATRRRAAASREAG